MDGLDDIQKKLIELQKKAQSIEGETKVPIDEILSVSFMKKYTDFDSVDDMLEASGFEVNSQEKFDHIPDEEWDDFISKNTRFDSWEKLLEKAGVDWASRHLGF